MPESIPGTVTMLLQAWHNGEFSAFDQLVSLVYRDLYKIAVGRMRKAPDVSIQPTELVNSSYMRLVDAASIDWKNRDHFFAIASKVMHRVLVDLARKKRALARGAAVVILPLEDVEDIGEEVESVEILDLHRALGKLKKQDNRMHEIVVCRFFGGLKVDAIAGILGVSVATVKRDWKIAKGWIYHELKR